MLIPFNLSFPNTMPRESSTKKDMCLLTVKDILLEASFLPFRMLFTQPHCWSADMKL